MRLADASNCTERMPTAFPQKQKHDQKRPLLWYCVLGWTGRAEALMSVFVATFASVRVTHELFGCEMRRWEITDQDGSQACTCGSSVFTDLCSFAICCDHISSFLKIMIHVSSQDPGVSCTFSCNQPRTAI